MIKYIYIDIFLALAFFAPVVAAIFYFREIKWKGISRDGVLAFTGTVSLLCFVGLCLAHSKLEAKFQDWFFKGEIVKKEVFVEGDGESVDHFENRFFLDFEQDPPINAQGGVEFLLLMGIVGGLACTSFFYISNYKSKEKPMKRTYEEDDREERQEIFDIIFRIILATGLVLCLLNLPYRYYDIFRMVMTIGCIYLASRQLKKNNFSGWLFLWTMIILFNPLDEIYLTRTLWNVIDVIIAVVLLAWSVKAYIDRQNE